MFNLTKQVHVSLSVTRLIEWYTEICFQIEIADGVHGEYWSGENGKHAINVRMRRSLHYEND